MHWNVGKVKITKIVELETVGSTRFILPLATNEEIRKLPWLIPHFATEEGRLKMSIHSLVVETPTRRIVVDTGLGNDKEGRNVPAWNNRQGPFLQTMREAGFAPDSIDTVLCTHLHVDHVGWNTRLVGGRWVPTFVNARYVFGRTEYEYWRDQRRARQGGGFQRFGEADRRCRQGRPRRQRRQAVRRDHPDPDPGPQPGPYERSYQIGRRTGPAHRRRRPPSLPDGASRLVSRPSTPTRCSRRRRGANCSRVSPIRRRW